MFGALVVIRFGLTSREGNEMAKSADETKRQSKIRGTKVEYTDAWLWRIVVIETERCSN